MSQEVKYIDIAKLVLWTENPRDPIYPEASDQDIVDLALSDKSSKWNLKKLAKEMGEYFDFSELPTVVFHKNKPIVYDGNRRIILGKIKHNCVQISPENKIQIPDFPIEIPCNVCTKDIALQNVLRKHGNSGSWSPLDRDLFLHKFLNQEKSNFLKLEENLGIISANPKMNQGFVKKEIFSSEKLSELGFGFEGDSFQSKHSQSDTLEILKDIVNQVENKKITTRKNRGQIISLLNKSNRDTIENNRNKKLVNTVAKLEDKTLPEPAKQRKTRRTKTKVPEIFGETLYLKPGDVSNLYRDIVDLYNFYLEKKDVLSNSFSSLVRMSLRLLCEAASKDTHQNDLGNYVKHFFPLGKKNLNSDVKTTLANKNVKEGTMLQLLHTGAHNYHAANDIETTLAMSLIIGEMLKISHGK